MLLHAKSRRAGEATAAANLFTWWLALWLAWISHPCDCFLSSQPSQFASLPRCQPWLHHCHSTSMAAWGSIKEPKCSKNGPWSSARATETAYLKVNHSETLHKSEACFQRGFKRWEPSCSENPAIIFQWELWVLSTLENLAVNPQSTPFASLIGCGV